MQQTVSRPQSNPNVGSNNSKNSHSSVVLILALLLFALSGLMTGFATGAFTRPKQPQQQVNKNHQATPPPAVTQTKTPQQTSTLSIVPLGCPMQDRLFSPEVADGKTPYTFSVHATDRAAGTCNVNNNPLHASGITFKMWLIKRLPKNHGITFLPSAQSLLDNISSPTDGKLTDGSGKTTDTDIQEIPQSLQFTNTAQAQQSDSQGHVTWQYTVSPDVPNGDYNLVVLADSAGKSYNWSWFQIDIKKAS